MMQHHMIWKELSTSLRNTKGVECAIFMYQTNTLEYKVACRSTERLMLQRLP